MQGYDVAMRWQRWWLLNGRYTVNDFKGCALKNGETFKYRGKAYTNTDTTHVDSLAMTLSYVCNQQSRRRDIGVTATAIMKTKCA